MSPAVGKVFERRTSRSTNKRRRSRANRDTWLLLRRRDHEYDDPPLLPERRFALAQGAVIEPGRPGVVELSGGEVEDFYHAHLGESNRTMLIWSIRRQHIEVLEPFWSGIGILQKINNCRWVNKYFRAVNSRLEPGGVFAGCVEVNGQRRRRIFRKYPAPVARAYCGVDFIVHRIWPKIPILKKAYFAMTRGHNRPMAMSEVLGRLVSCGFEVIEHREIRGLSYFAARKQRDAVCVSTPTYGPFCRLWRVGRHGKLFPVFKLRTMHPYAEFLQDYIYQCNQLQAGGKFKDDFRVTPWGAWLRRLWLDELPMLLNLFRGEIKPVGVRPLSAHYYHLYPRELQELRKRHTPGLLPPFYVDMPKTFDEIVASELRYLRAYEKAPLRTDIRYFFAAVWNIVVKRARSA